MGRRRAALQEESPTVRERDAGVVVLVEYFVPTGLHPCTSFLRLNQAPALPCVHSPTLDARGHSAVGT